METVIERRVRLQREFGTKGLHLLTMRLNVAIVNYMETQPFPENAMQLAMDANVIENIIWELFQIFPSED